jgi:hypothetical protein
MFPHLDTLLQRLADNYNEDDALTFESYFDLMASTTILSAMANIQHIKMMKVTTLHTCFDFSIWMESDTLTWHDVRRAGGHDKTSQSTVPAATRQSEWPVSI